MASREIHVAPDRFEVTAEDAILVTELQSAIAVCVYDAAEQAGALLHLRCIVRSSKPADVTDTTLATELLLLDRCIEALREAAPSARQLQARIVAHLADDAQARPVCETVLIAGASTSSPTPACGCCPRTSPRARYASLRFRPSMGWVHTRLSVRRVPVPAEVSQALERLFGEPVAHVVVIEHSWFARLHCARPSPPRAAGASTCAASAAAFFADPWLLLHEYCHVIRQWQPGALTVRALPAGVPAARLLEQPLRGRGAGSSPTRTPRAPARAAGRVSAQQRLAPVEPPGDGDEQRPEQRA